MNIFADPLRGRCCGRKPLFYKGGSWRSPPGCPKLVCLECDREFDAKSGEQRENWAWKLDGDQWLRKMQERS